MCVCVCTLILIAPGYIFVHFVDTSYLLFRRNVAQNNPPLTYAQFSMIYASKLKTICLSPQILVRDLFRWNNNYYFFPKVRMWAKYRIVPNVFSVSLVYTIYQIKIIYHVLWYIVDVLKNFYHIHYISILFLISECRFSDKRYELEDTWHPDLGPPFGVMYCVHCECVAVRFWNVLDINHYSI